MFLVFSLFYIFSLPALADIDEANRFLLPNPLRIFTDGTTIINHPAKNFTKKLLPINNDFKDYPGCYIACYSHQETDSIYSVSNDIHVMAQIRVPGKYNNRICEPTLFTGNDISKSKAFSDICSSKIKACKNTHCWAGGDTGGWLGIQSANDASPEQ